MMWRAILLADLCTATQEWANRDPLLGHKGFGGTLTQGGLGKLLIPHYHHVDPTPRPTPRAPLPTPVLPSPLSISSIFSEADVEKSEVRFGATVVVTAGRHAGWVGVVDQKLDNSRYRVEFADKGKSIVFDGSHIEPYTGQSLKSLKLKVGDKVKVVQGKRNGQHGRVVKVMQNGLVKVQLPFASHAINFKPSHLVKETATPAPTIVGTKPAWQRLLEGPTNAPTASPTPAPTFPPTPPTTSPTPSPTHKGDIFAPRQEDEASAEKDLSAAIAAEEADQSSTCSGTDFEKVMFKSIGHACHAYHGRGVVCARKCEGLIQLSIQSGARSFTDQRWHSCEIGWRRYIQNDFCWPKQCHSTMNYICGGFRGKLMLRSTPHMKAPRHQGQSGVGFKIEEYERACAQPGARCTYYDACDACVAHYIWGMRPIKHWDCWLDQWLGYKTQDHTPIQVGSRVNITGLHKHPEFNGRLGVAAKSLKPKGIDGFEIQIDGMVKKKLFRRKNLLSAGLPVGNVVKIMGGRFKGHVGHVKAAVIGGGAYTIKIRVYQDGSMQDRMVDVQSKQIAIPPPQNNFCGDVRAQNTHELLVEFSNVELETATHYHSRGIDRLAPALKTADAYMWRHLEGIQPHQISKWNTHQHYRFLIPVNWREYPEDAKRPNEEDADKYMT